MLSKVKKGEEPPPEEKKFKRKNSLTDESSLSSSSSSIHSDDTCSSYSGPLKTQSTMTDIGTSPDEYKKIATTTSPLNAPQVRNMNQLDIRRSTVNKNKVNVNVNKEREKLLTAKNGYGIAATGLIDSFPWERAGTQEEIAKQNYYSDLVGKKYDLQAEIAMLNEKESKGVICPAIRAEWRKICNKKLSLYRCLEKLSGVNPFLRQCLLSILDGKVDNFPASFPLPKDPLFGSKQFPQHDLVQKILGHLEDTTTGMNLIMYLSTDFRLTQSFKGKISCAESNHSNCTILSQLLANLPPQSAKEWIRKTTKRTSRNPLHFAVIAGSPCHIDVLAKYVGNADLNRKDLSGRAPLHYALSRNAPMQVRQLMWLGADISLPGPTLRHPMLDRDSGKEASLFHIDRLEALNRCMKSWLTYVFDGSMKIVSSFSDIHLVKMENVSAAKLEFEVELKNLTFVQHLENMHLMLFSIPVQWTGFDSQMPGKYPHIVRQKLTIQGFEDVAANIFPKNPTLHQLIDGRRLSETVHCALPNIDAGVYAWWIPKTLAPGHSVITFSMDPSQIEPSQRDNILLFQIYAVRIEDNHPTLYKPTKASLSAPIKTHSSEVVNIPQALKKQPKLKTD